MGAPRRDNDLPSPRNHGKHYERNLRGERCCVVASVPVPAVDGVVGPQHPAVACEHVVVRDPLRDKWGGRMLVKHIPDHESLVYPRAATRTATPSASAATGFFIRFRKTGSGSFSGRAPELPSGRKSPAPLPPAFN